MYKANDRQIEQMPDHLQSQRQEQTAGADRSQSHPPHTTRTPACGVHKIIIYIILWYSNILHTHTPVPLIQPVHLHAVMRKTLSLLVVL